MSILTPILNYFSPRQKLTAGNIDTRLQSDQASRQHQYAFNHAMLKNRVYRTEAYGGFRAQVFKEAFNMDCSPELRLVGAYNPTREIVDAYQNCLRGAFGGQELKVADKVEGRDVNSLLVDEAESPIGKIWRWSNLDTAKSLMQEWAANLGTVGIRIVAQNDAEPDNRRVTLQIDHPGVIYDFDTDDRNNVTDIELRYKDMDGPFGNREEVEVREVIGKDRFVKEVDGVNVLEPDQRRNELGVCPYVILRHREEGEPFGRWAYDGSEDIIHWINLLMVNQGESVMEHAWPQWFAAAGGPKPEEFTIGRRKVAYVRMEPDTPAPIFEPLVAALDQGGATEHLTVLMDKLHGRQPEVVLSDTKVLSGQSGETIAKLQIAAEAAIMRARGQYEHALIRAIQIGLSEGIRMGMWDLGSGMGSAEQADKSYQSGEEDFAFAERSALPMTPFDKINNAKAEVAAEKEKLGLGSAAQSAGMDEQAALEKAGVEPKKAKAIVKRKRKVDVVPGQGL